VSDQRKILSEEEINEIVEKVCDKIEKRLYQNVGKGIIALAMKGVIIGLIALAGYGAGTHFIK
jgi:tetrahydromethanopterin S-methyltransferase subunit G